MKRAYFHNPTNAMARFGAIAFLVAMSCSLSMATPCFAVKSRPSGTVTTATIKNAPEQLNALEMSICGQTNQGSILKRIQQLELQVFSKTQRGSLSSRISALQKFAGMETKQSQNASNDALKTQASAQKTAHDSEHVTKETSSDYMPPLPPYFDNGQEPVKKAPHAALSHPTNTSEHTKAASAHSKHHKTAGKADSQLEQAIRLHQDGKVVEAETSLQQILQNHPGNADACFSLGAIAETKGDLTKALDYYTSAMQANPTDEEARIAVAEISRKIKDTHANTASQYINGPFVNPMAPPSERVLQGHALELGQNNPYNANAAFNSPPIGTLSVNNPSRTIPVAPVAPSNKSVVARSVARTLARAALGAALSQTGLHCPACALLRGF